MADLSVTPTPTPTPPAPRSSFAAFASSDFRRYIAARVFATLAVQAQWVAVGFQVYAITHKPLSLGYVGLARFIPVASLSLVGGSAADHFDRRSVALVGTLGFIGVALGLYAITLSPNPSMPLLYGLVMAFGVITSFFSPAVSAILPSLIPPEHLTSAVSWQTLIWQLSAVVGPSLGGAIYAITERPGPVYLTSAMGLGLSLFAFGAIRLRRPPLARKRPSFAEALAGLGYVRRNKILLGSISLDFFAVFLGGAVALLPVYAADVLDVGPRGLGIMRGAAPVGAGLMGLYLAVRPLGRNAGIKMLVCVGVFGAATIVFGVSRSFGLSLLALAVLGAADMVSVIVRKTLEQAATPDAMRGRVAAVNQVFIGASNELGEFESGVTAAWVGAVPSVVIGGLGTIVVVLLWAGLFPEIRRVDRLEDVKAST
jgi:MFS family permease